LEEEDELKKEAENLIRRIWNREGNSYSERLHIAYRNVEEAVKKEVPKILKTADTIRRNAKLHQLEN